MANFWINTYKNWNAFPTPKISHNLGIQTISCCMQCVTRSELVNFYISMSQEVKKGLLQLWILRALNNPQSSILNPRERGIEVSRASVLVFTYANKKICLETAVFRVYREGLRREWIRNTFPQVPRRQRSVHKMDSRDTEGCWMRWEISASTQSFTLKENKPHELQGHDNHCFQTINPKDFLPFAKLRFSGGSFAVIISTLQPKL